MNSVEDFYINYKNSSHDTVVVFRAKRISEGDRLLKALRAANPEMDNFTWISWDWGMCTSKHSASKMIGVDTFTYMRICNRVSQDNFFSILDEILIPKLKLEQHNTESSAFEG